MSQNEWRVGPTVPALPACSRVAATLGVPVGERRAARLSPDRSAKAVDEKLAAGNHPGGPGEPWAFAGAGGQPFLQLASADAGAFRRPRPGAVEADQRQSAADASLCQPGAPRELRAR